jgi:CRP-like cAMP-binding protein
MLCTGESFGELALLQRSATRTATVVVAPATGTDGSGAQGDAAAGAASSGALLIKVSRAAYDSVVRALHVAALEELLGFLGSLPPFAGLPRELLTSLAVFARPLAAQPGQRVAAAGAAADALIVLQEGELRLLDGCAPGAAAGSTSVHHHGAPDGRPRARGATAEAAAVLAKHGSASSSGLDAALGRSASSGVSQGGGVQLAILGPGSLLGENVLGYDPEEVLVCSVPADACAASPAGQCVYMYK